MLPFKLLKLKAICKMGRFEDVVMGKQIRFIIFVLLLVLVQGCTLKERSALLQIKSFFRSVTPAHARQIWSLNVLPSWDHHSTNSCCLWERVECDHAMQHVTALSLHHLAWLNRDAPITLHLSLFHPFHKLTTLNLSINWIQHLVGSPGASLLSLKELNLVANVLSGSFPAQVLANFKQLRVLGLSFNNLNGSIQNQGLCNLKNLQELRVADNDLSGNLPKCLGYMTSLQVLDFSNNLLSGDATSILPNLTSLKTLCLSQNHFQGELYLNALLNHSRLEFLMLSSSGLQLKIDDTTLSSTSQLEYLYLSDCSLHMQSNSLNRFLLHQHKLSWLDLSHNGLTGSFPSWILYNNSRIQALVLRNNSFEGILSFPTDPKIDSFYFMDISRNRFYGHFSENIGSIMPTLLDFNASNNFFDGGLPASIGNMTELQYLDFSNNNLSGEVPSSIFTKCTSLMILMLSNNSLQGDIIPENMNLTHISQLYLDNNHFNGTIQQTLLKSDKLLFLDLSNNEVVGGIPSGIGKLSSLYILLLSNNRLHGPIPRELLNLQQLHVLDLSYNGLNGVIPSSCNLPLIKVLSLRGNFFTGPLPVGLSSSIHLYTLDLSDNNFSGFIPPWIGNFSNLNVLLLRKNRLQGELPAQLCQLHYINILDVSNNNIFGFIPSCLANFSFGNTSTIFDISYLEEIRQLLSYLMPFDAFLYFSPMFGFALDGKEEVVFLTKSRYDTYGGYILGHMSGLDLSCNQLTGSIPEELGHLPYIRALNLSHNQLTGSIPSSFSMLRSVESLDLSYNKLSGAIPSQLAEVTTLGTFNVSYNNLSGEVPNTGQFATFGENNYKGNPFLQYGSFLKQRHATPSPDVTKGIEDMTVDFDWQVFFWSFGMSGSIMMLACIVVLWINPYWHRAWFQFIEFHVLWRFI